MVGSDDLGPKLAPGARLLAPQWNRCGGGDCEMKDTCKRYVAHLLDVAAGHDLPPAVAVKYCTRDKPPRSHYLPLEEKE